MILDKGKKKFTITTVSYMAVILNCMRQRYLIGGA
jgi:hypothetical protein